MALLVSLALGSVGLAAACGGSDTTPTGGVTGTGGSSTSSSTGAGPSGSSSSTGGGGGKPTACIPATGSVAGSGTLVDGTYTSTVSIDTPASCTRTYTLSTTAPLRDNEPMNPRTFAEGADDAVIRTGNDLFDALYALALADAKEDSVDAISNGSFNGGQPIPCAAGGCFETGRLWTYVWTRDTSYAATLGLAALDPTRMRNSLELKTSKKRDGTDREIVQDTGSGGSHPVSSDRVVWAMGAWELLKYLDGAERAAFLDLAYEAISDTAERDRVVVFDPTDGLYRGEQSFLDWREQSYPAWTATDTVQIAMSKALSTNVAHYNLLDVASKLATEKGDTAAANKYAQWASSLKAAIAAKLWLSDANMFSTFVTTELDPSPTHQYDLLGSAFAVLFDVATPTQAASVLAGYPHLSKGAPVIFPEQKDTRIYHNRAIWPFATAFWLRAAAKVKNAQAIDLNVASLVRGAAMNLSNMENFEVTTGANWVDDGAFSGPVVNSQRQLWSVGGYLSMVHDVVFGLEASQTGIRFSPHVTRKMRSTLFAGVDSIALSHFHYKGRRISVVVHLPAADTGDGVLDVASVKLDGKDVGTGETAPNDLADGSVFDVVLSAGAPSTDTIRVISDADVADYRNLFGPKNPNITGVAVSGAGLSVSWDPNGELASDVTFDVYRDGAKIASALPGSQTSYADASASDYLTKTHCYSVEAVFAGSGNASQHARPVCYWGPGNVRIVTVGAQSFTAAGGTWSTSHGKGHYDDWGNPSDSLTATNVFVPASGTYYLQVNEGNGAGDYTTGITCGVKAIEVFDGATKVGGGVLVMPHTASWDNWADSSFVRVTLSAGKPYTVVIHEDASSFNMSDFEHFMLYGGMGGTGGRFDKVNISELKLLGL
jgi:hypothetical protein